MSVVGPWHRVKVFITARTYPSPARKGVEVSCTAGITDDGEWIRLFPVPYRFLGFDKRFRKWQWIEVEVAKASDARRESHQVNLDSITILGDPVPPDKYWHERKKVIVPLQAPSLCSLKAERDRYHYYPTLGFFKPKSITSFVIDADAADWTAEEKGKLLQGTFGENVPFEVLEKVPYKFSYAFTCADPACQGHQLSCVDWELGQAWRKWHLQYGPEWKSKFRDKFETEIILKRDTSFLVGTVATHPGSWIIVGLFYPMPTP